MMVWIASTAFFLLVMSWVTKKLHHVLGLLTLLCLCFGILLGFYHQVPSEKVIKGITEITLILFLFVDGTRIHIPKLLHYHKEAFRQLTIGYIIQCVLGAALAYFLLHISLLPAFLLSIALAAIDTKVAPAVIENRLIPPRISGILHLESFVTPLLTVFLIVFLKESSYLSLVISILAGGITGLLCVLITKRTIKWHLSHRTFLVSSLFLAPFALYYLCEVLHLNGWLGVMALSLTLGHLGRSFCDGLFDFARRQGKLLFFLFVIVFGCQVLPVLSSTLSLMTIIYAIGVLFVIRGLAVVSSLTWSRFKVSTLFFCLFFGPRAVVPIAIGLLFFSNQPSLFIPLYGVTLLSLLIHTLFSYPLSHSYGESIQTSGKAELLPTVSFPK